MASESLVEIVNTLTPEQQAAVREFVDFLRAKNADRKTPFQAAVSEFIDQHPDLLQRLAQ